MKVPATRILERIGGGILVVAGATWLVLGLRSLSGDSFDFRGAVVVVLIAFFLILAGAMLSKPRSSTAGRLLAAIVCLLGAFREMMLMSHHDDISLASAGEVGFGLLVLYGAILILIVVNHLRERRAAAPSALQ